MACAEIYLKDPSVNNYKKKAYLCLAKSALWSPDMSGFEKLKQFANSGDKDAQFVLAYEFYHKRQSRFHAVNLAMRAADQGHKEATRYIKETVFPAEIYRHIAKNYESGREGIKPNIQFAILFYNKAIRLKDAEAAVDLAELLLAHDEIKENVNEAFIAFINAVQLGEHDCLTTLECLGQDVTSDLQVALGDLYQHPPFNNQTKAIYWYQKASEGEDGSMAAKNYLNKL